MKKFVGFVVDQKWLDASNDKEIKFIWPLLYCEMLLNLDYKQVKIR